MTKNRLILGAFALGLSANVMAQPEKFAVVEEKTGTWCGWCPYGTVQLAALEESEPNFIGIAIHNGDPMANAYYDDASDVLPGFSGYPYAAVDRVVGDHAWYAPNGVTERLAETPVASIAVGGYIEGGQLEIRIKANFTEAVSGDWRLAAVVTEDHVTGGSGYAQANYFAPGVAEPDGIPLSGAGHVWNEEPHPVPASDMVYDHVARVIADNSFGGVEGSLPETIEADVDYWYSYYVDVDGSWDLENISVVAMLVEPSGAINNAGKGRASKNEVGTVGITEQVNNFAVKAYPNPTAGNLNVAIELNEASTVSMEVVNMLGATVRMIESQNLSSGTFYNEFDMSDLTEGVYFVKTTVNEAVEMTKIVVKK
ncbi:T9SS type A sorting domain-containing protein [Crocinitomix algicola]|uniref:T9SS type A sorting domain-containing protein n=1 Tax=Crocinitomix algicola TaxID=1740263 RepID=UPI000871D597|nr:Omp28-related outer membrane protein [Crocinitomix algicola]